MAENTRYFTHKGLEVHLKRIRELETKMSELEYKMGAACADGNTWHDNAAYDHLLEDIRVANTRLEDAHKLLKGAQIIQYTPCNGKANMGTRVTLLLNNRQKVFDIVAYGESDIDKNKILYDTPVAKAVIGHTGGEEVEFSVKEGDKRKIKILKVEPIPTS